MSSGVKKFVIPLTIGNKNFTIKLFTFQCLKAHASRIRLEGPQNEQSHCCNNKAGQRHLHQILNCPQSLESFVSKPHGYKTTDVSNTYSYKAIAALSAHLDFHHFYVITWNCVALLLLNHSAYNLRWGGCAYTDHLEEIIIFLFLKNCREVFFNYSNSLF